MKVEKYEFPEDLYYHREDHLWVKIIEDNRVRIGVDDFGAKEAGELDFVELPEEGDEFERGDVFATMESGKWVGRLRAPVGGTIVEVNSKVDEDPTIINRDPYGEGWLVVMETKSLEEDLKTLLSGKNSEEIENWIRREMRERLGKG